MDDVASVSAGCDRTLAIKVDGTLWVWGFDDYGAFADGTVSVMSTTPQKVMADVSFACAGWWHSAIIKTDGSLWTFGNNKYGKLGDGTTEDRYTPVKIMDDVMSVSAGRFHTVAVKKDGSLWAWGDSQHGQLGDGTATKYTDDRLTIIDNNDKVSPVKIMDNVSTANASYLNTLAVKKDGTLWVWGADFNGSLGVGKTFVLEKSPVKVLSDVQVPSSKSTAQTPALSLGKPSSWAKTQVNTAISANLVPQSLQSKYTQATTRAEFCALAITLYESLRGEITERKSFADTNDVNVQKAAAIGVVSGVGGGRFDPDGTLTREQAAVMLSRLADAIGKPLPKQSATFSDNSSISTWAIE